MGLIADSIMAYAQPLLDNTDGSKDQMNNALALAQLCWNLALLPEKKREEGLAMMRPSFKMNDAEFEEFRRTVVLPMIRRHHEMFPSRPWPDLLNQAKRASVAQACSTTTSKAKRYQGTGRNAPCPCKSGKKYKRCCGG